MATVGRSLLFIAFSVSLWGLITTVAGAVTGRKDLADSGRRSMPVLMALLVGSFLQGSRGLVIAGGVVAALGSASEYLVHLGAEGC
ncbi:MAG: hypothetical protein NTY57_07025 [Solirubrobacterales bacterium]|nr:hypothetical protein [Solirubrobacterales bacterium]